MSRKINVNPDHYKVAGRQRQGENIVQERQKLAYTKADRRGRGGKGARASGRRGR
jgi:hypothetical protein